MVLYLTGRNFCKTKIYAMRKHTVLPSTKLFFSHTSVRSLFLLTFSAYQHFLSPVFLFSINVCQLIFNCSKQNRTLEFQKMYEKNNSFLRSLEVDVQKPYARWSYHQGKRDFVRLRHVKKIKAEKKRLSDNTLTSFGVV